MERAVGAVIVGTDFMFLGIILGEAAMFPHASELLELIHGHLMVGCVTRLFLIVEHRGAADGPAGCRINAMRIFLLAPPEHLVEPMNAPVAQLAVAVIEILSPAAGMDFRIKGTHGGEAAPQIPVQA